MFTISLVGKVNLRVSCYAKHIYTGPCNRTHCTVLVLFISQLATFQSRVLPKYFRHRSYTSFVRSLNMYGFRRVGIENTREFAHPDFRRGRLDLLTRVKRKTSKKKAQGDQLSETLAAARALTSASGSVAGGSEASGGIPPPSVAGSENRSGRHAYGISDRPPPLSAARSTHTRAGRPKRASAKQRARQEAQSVGSGGSSPSGAESLPRTTSGGFVSSQAADRDSDRGRGLSGGRGRDGDGLPQLPSEWEHHGGARGGGNGRGAVSDLLLEAARSTQGNHSHHAGNRAASGSGLAAGGGPFRGHVGGVEGGPGPGPGTWAEGLEGGGRSSSIGGGMGMRGP